MISRWLVLRMGIAQLVSWGATFYMIGAFGAAIAGDLGWAESLVYGGFSLALLVMGLSAPTVGRLIDRHGGRLVMSCGAVFNAVGCWGIALGSDAAAYYAAWACLGIGMQMTLYDAGFATLARIGGVGARRPMAQITLLGGLASTTFWPLGGLLGETLGWRGGLMVYGALALATLPLHLAIPRGHAAPMPRPDRSVAPAGLRGLPPEARLAAGLYALVMTSANFLGVGMASHMIVILTGLGLGFSAAVWTGTLRGVGQSVARLGEVLFGRAVPPLALNLLACALLPLAFAIGLFSGVHALAGIAFAFLYGAGNGLLTITRGTVPLVLFDTRSYGAIMGLLVAPGLLVSAAAPLIYALAIAQLGARGTMLMSMAVALAALAAGAWLLMHRRPRAG